MSISTLPTELQELICSFIDSQHDLASLSQTSKSLHVVAERFLYRSISITSVSQIGRFARSVKRRGRANHIRDFKLDVYQTNFSVYDWAARQLPETSVTRDAYVNGLRFNTEFLTLFPKVETLYLHAQQWPLQATRRELEVSLGQGLLTHLRWCSLAFVPTDQSSTSVHWDVAPFQQIFSCPTLETLELIRATGDAPILQGSADAAESNWVCNFRSLRLLDCHLSHRWLDSHMRLPRGLRELDVVVTSEKAASFAEHMFLQRCSCIKPICSTLQSLSYVNLRTVSNTHSVRQFARFEHLSELTVSATELFGDMSRWSVDTVLQNMALSIPPNLQVLHLYVHKVDMYGDAEGHSQGVWRVLIELMSPENKHHVPLLREIILHVIAKHPEIPLALLHRGTVSGIRIRLATVDEMMRLRERQRLRMLMS